MVFCGMSTGKQNYNGKGIAVREEKSQRKAVCTKPMSTKESYFAQLPVSS